MQTKMTPLMQQYWEIKAQHEDKVLLFRMGDFFEMFHHDAEVAAPILGIALTQRNKKDADSAKMCGVPYHSIATPIAKLLASGHKVAICDQIEDPALAKGLVKRAVTRVLTPGMVYDPDTLDQLSANYMSAFDDVSVAFVDVTTGEAFVYSVQGAKERQEILRLLSPVELVHTAAQKTLIRELALSDRVVLSQVDEGALNAETRLTDYIRALQGPEAAMGLGQFERRHRRAQMRLSATVVRHLEMFESARGEREGTLFEALRRTETSAGARLLKSWLGAPLMDRAEIQVRQNEISAWVKQPASLKIFREQMSKLGDVERRLGKIHTSTFNARDLVALAESMRVGERLHQLHPAQPHSEAVTRAAEFARELEATFLEELPLGVKEGGLIREGAVAELDELIRLTQDSQQLLVELEAREKEATGIASLKVRYNNVFGFYIELTKTHAHKAPGHYLRKQTLTNAERYTTDELSALEEKILSARSRRDQLEYEIFNRFRGQILERSSEWLQLARVWTRWDVLSGLAWLALERKYVCPELAESGTLDIQLGRHPVLEQRRGRGAFVPNSVTLDPGACLLLTGPNMAGKSTLMRQVALIAIMAQIGAFVPAERARLPLLDGIFTRIGASDSLHEGLSTFMVEMTETSEILGAVTPRSLVVMDEVGRGTSTYDGMSLAQAILEHLVAHPKPYLLFATHYHELTSMTHVFPQVHNAHMTVQERTGQIQFLHTLKMGPANRSYGVHVAKLAGLPATVTQRAQQILLGLEGSQLSLGDSRPAAPTESPVVEQPAWANEVKNLNLSRMTPLEALNKLFEWQREVSS